MYNLINIYTVVHDAVMKANPFPIKFYGTGLFVPSRQEGMRVFIS